MRVCKSCGTELKWNMMYCPKCGTLVEPEKHVEVGTGRLAKLLRNWKFWAVVAIALLLMIRVFGFRIRYYLSGDVNLSSAMKQMASAPVEELDLDVTEPDVTEPDVTEPEEEPEVAEEADEETAIEEPDAAEGDSNPYAGGTGESVAEETEQEPEASVDTQQVAQTQTTTSPYAVAQTTQAQTQTTAGSVDTTPQVSVDAAAVQESLADTYETYLVKNLDYIFENDYRYARNGSDFVTDVWVSGGAAEVEAIQNGKIALSAWTEFRDMLGERAAGLYDRTSSLGLDDAHLTLNFISDVDGSSVLLTFRQ